jgi:hypothetical protein
VEVQKLDYQNIILSIPKEILKKIKHIAIERNTSVSGLLASHLEQIVAREDKYKTARSRQDNLCIK